MHKYKLRSALTAILLGMSAVAALSTPSAAQISIQVNLAPPALPVYVQPALPAPGYFWTPGYWAWNGADYYWVPGTWVQPPRVGVLWTPGYWGFADGVYVYHGGYWGPHVGFYGGVSYGFGYGGLGYEGGYWNNGAFFYNRTVNNFGRVNITNVYNKTVIVNNNSKVSFNGPGGSTAKPTPEELAADKDQHIEPTAEQTRHEQEASTNKALTASANHGKPPITAVSHAGDLKGGAERPATGETKPAKDETKPEKEMTPKGAEDATKREPKAPAPHAAMESHRPGPVPGMAKRPPPHGAAPCHGEKCH